MLVLFFFSRKLEYVGGAFVITNMGMSLIFFQEMYFEKYFFPMAETLWVLCCELL